MTESTVETTESIQPVKVNLMHYELTEMVSDLEKKFQEGYTFDGGCYRVGRAIYIDLVLASAKEEELAKQAEQKAKDLADKEEASTLAKEELEKQEQEEKEKEEARDKNLDEVIKPKELLDAETKALVEIDWDMLKTMVGEDDRAGIKEYGKRWGVNLPKTMSAKNQLTKFKEAIDKM